MFVLIASILSSTGIFVIFKLIQRFKADTLQVIITNYFVAAGIGFLVFIKSFTHFNTMSENWLLFAGIIGILFIIMFLILGLSSEKAGITKTTVSAKLSVILPILFSFIIDPLDKISLIKIIGITVALLAVLLTIYKKRSGPDNHKAILLPFVLFIGMGIVDSLVKYSHYKIIGLDSIPVFTAILFLISAITGTIFYLFTRRNLLSLINKKSLFWGSLLGIANFGAIFFFLNALSSHFDSSVVFGINNIGIVLLCVLSGVFLFKESISTLNKIGIALSFASILILSYS